MNADACLICGGERLVKLSSAVGERAYCETCFHGWRTRQPHFAYANTAMCSLGTPSERIDAQVRFFSPFASPRPTILEIGCATGELAVATKKAMNVARYEAIELSPAADQATVHVDRMHRLPLPRLLVDGAIDGAFDLILMSHVLEHLEDPVAELRAMKSVLKPTGAIFIEVPNGAGNRRLPIDDNRSHLHFFSPSSLTRMMANEGLQTIATATDVRLDARYADSLQIIARPFHAPTWSRALLSDSPLLAGEAEVVVWGAGDAAHEVLANFFDPARIAFFIDRSPEKQGRPCLGRPVRAPEALGTVPRTVLVNSIDFADAIARDIGRLYPGIPHRLVPIGDLLS